MTNPLSQDPIEALREGIGITLGALVLLGAAIIMAGWLLDVPTLIQIAPGWVPVQFNTALCLGLLGLSYVVQAWGRSGWPYALLANWLAAFTLLQFMTGVDIGIDNFFHEAQVTTLTYPPGRMAPNAAVALLLLSIAALSPSRNWALSLASLSLGLGIAAMGGYLLDLSGNYAWGQWTHMAPRTSLMICAVAVASIADAWYMRSFFAFFPLTIVVGVVCVSVVVSLWDTPESAQLIPLTVGVCASIIIVTDLALLRWQNVLRERATEREGWIDEADERLGKWLNDEPPHRIRNGSYPAPGARVDA